MCQIPKGLDQGSLTAAILRNWGRNQKVGHLWEIRPREVVIKHHLLRDQSHGAETAEPEDREEISLSGCCYDNEVFLGASPPVPPTGPECKVPSNPKEQSKVNRWTHGGKRKKDKPICDGIGIQYSHWDRGQTDTLSDFQTSMTLWWQAVQAQLWEHSQLHSICLSSQHVLTDKKEGIILSLG